MIDTATAWVSANWWQIAIGLVILMKVLNLVTRHFKDYKGLVRWCVFLIDVLDVFKSSHGGIPGSKPPVVPK